MDDIASRNARKAIARASQCTQRLMEKGVSLEALQWPISDSDFCTDLMLFWMRKGASLKVQETEEQKAARQIMGDNFLGLPEVAKWFNYPFSESIQKLIGQVRIPFSREVFIQHKHTHLLFIDVGHSIIDIINRCDKRAPNVFYPLRDEYKNKKFITHFPNHWLWRLISKKIVNKSRNKSWDGQQKMLSGNEKIPSARQIVYAYTLNYLARGEKLLEDVYVRTTTKTLNGSRVLVGQSKGGLHINSNDEDTPREDEGIITCLQSEQINIC